MLRRKRVSFFCINYIFFWSDAVLALRGVGELMAWIYISFLLPLSGYHRRTFEPKQSSVFFVGGLSIKKRTSPTLPKLTFSYSRNPLPLPLGKPFRDSKSALRCFLCGILLVHVAYIFFALPLITIFGYLLQIIRSRCTSHISDDPFSSFSVHTLSCGQCQDLLWNPLRNPAAWPPTPLPRDPKRPENLPQVTLKSVSDTWNLIWWNLGIRFEYFADPPFLTELCPVYHGGPYGYRPETGCRYLLNSLLVFLETLCRDLQKLLAMPRIFLEAQCKKIQGGGGGSLVVALPPLSPLPKRVAMTLGNALCILPESPHWIS